MHHSLGTGDFEVFPKMFSSISEDQVIIKDRSYISELDRVLRKCWLKKRPVYIGIPTDVID